MSTFRVGDKVRRIRGDWDGMKAGDTGEVRGISRVSVIDVALDRGHFSVGNDASFLELVEPAHVRVVTQGQAGGLKFDGAKDQWYLLLSGKGMIRALLGVVKILGFGAKKYAAHSWREVEDNERRYLDALFRHYAAIMEHGLQARDEESGELHIDHLNCNGLFLGELARKGSDAKQTQ